MMTYKQILEEGKKRLREANIVDGEHDAFSLLSFFADIDRTFYYTHMQEEPKEDLIQPYFEAIEKRAKHIPLQQITGIAPFYGYEFKVNEHVLIPRFDTEVLVDEVLKVIKRNKEPKKILDLCTGSGCILLTILKEARDVVGIGVDISTDALDIAKANAKALEVTTSFIKSDLFEIVQGKFDIIVSNPPYIKSAVIETLEEEVRVHEPMLALDGMEDGIYFYRKIIEQAPNYLNKGGYLCFEIGHDQGVCVSELLQKDFKDIQVIKDLAGLDRVVIASFDKTL